MRKPLFFLFALFICLGTISNAVSQTKFKADEGVQDVILDKTEVILSCPPNAVPEAPICREENFQIKILTTAEDAEKKGLTFYYLVTGGKIIGNGKDVIWDFTDAKPGNYSITVGVGKDGILKGNFITKKVVVRECPECLSICECASFDISAPSVSADAGETLIFTVKVTGGSQKSVIYNWVVSAGEIVEGQGTSQILVKTTKEMKGQTVTATVDVSGLCESCPRTASASAEVKDK